MLIKKIILSVSFTCLLFTPFPVIFSSPSDDVPDYALDRPIRFDRNDIDKFRELTYFSFYTFFKSGIDPDCIDMVNELKEELA